MQQGIENYYSKKKIDERIPAQFISNHCSKISSCIKKASEKTTRIKSSQLSWPKYYFPLIVSDNPITKITFNGWMVEKKNSWLKE